MHVKFIESSAILISWTLLCLSSHSPTCLLPFFLPPISSNQETKNMKKKSEEYDLCCLQESSVLVLIYDI